MSRCIMLYLSLAAVVTISVAACNRNRSRDTPRSSLHRSRNASSISGPYSYRNSTGYAWRSQPQTLLIQGLIGWGTTSSQRDEGGHAGAPLPLGLLENPER